MPKFKCDILSNFQTMCSRRRCLECKTKIFWCPVPGFLLEFVLLNLLLTAFTLLFSFLQSVTSQVSPYSQGFFFRLDCHKSIQLCCCKVLKFCFICIFFQEPLDLRRRSSGVLKVCLNSLRDYFCILCETFTIFWRSE